MHLFQLFQLFQSESFMGGKKVLGVWGEVVHRKRTPPNEDTY